MPSTYAMRGYSASAKDERRLNARQGPALEHAELAGPCQQRVGCVVQSRSYASVADFRNGAGDVGFAGLIALGRQAKEGGDGFGLRKPRRVIDAGAVSQQHQGADTRHRHQAAADLVPP